MKIPSIFTKSPKYHRFEYKPRYFDPKKEEHDARIERIRQEIAKEKGEKTVEENPYDYRARMSGAFQQARKRAKPQSELDVALVRLFIMLTIAVFLIGFLTWGKLAVYGLFLVIPVWVYFRFFRKPKE